MAICCVRCNFLETCPFHCALDVCVCLCCLSFFVQFPESESHSPPTNLKLWDWHKYQGIKDVASAQRAFTPQPLEHPSFTVNRIETMCKSRTASVIGPNWTLVFIVINASVLASISLLLLHLLLHFDALVETLRLWCQRMMHRLIGWTSGSEQHVTACACQACKFPMRFRRAVTLLPYLVALPCVPCSPDRDIRGKGSVLPRSGFGSGSVILLPSHPQEHHQTDLLLQSSWESLGSWLPEMSLLWIRLADCSPHFLFNEISDLFSRLRSGLMQLHQVLCYCSCWCQTFGFIIIIGRSGW